MGNDEDAAAKARRLVDQLHEVTASAEELAQTVADGIRRERAAGLSHRAVAHDSSSAKRNPKRIARKKR